MKSMKAQIFHYSITPLRHHPNYISLTRLKSLCYLALYKEKITFNNLPQPL